MFALYSPKICALYLSIRYHKMKPEYIHGRITALKGHYMCRVLLLHLDDKDNPNDKLVVELNKICFTNKLTLICCWSFKEGARYLEAFQIYRNKSPDCLMGSSYKQWVNSKKNKENQMTEQEQKREDVVDTLVQIKTISKTNVATVMGHFGSIAALSNCTEEQVAALPGFARKKVENLLI